MKKNNKNNKGFSLVELIIVIAIMAILIGVLAPQYLKFVERSRKSTDRQNVDEIIRAVQIYSADPEAPKSVADGDKITITTTATTLTKDTNGALADALNGAGIEVSKLKLKSSKWGADVVIVFSVDGDNVEATVTPADVAGGSTATPTP